MSGTRLPLLGARPTASAGSAVAAAPALRLDAPRPLLCIASAEADQPHSPAVLGFAQGLLRALAERGCRATVLVVAGECSGDALRALRSASPAQVIELPAAELGARAHEALAGLPERALALAVGAEFARQLRPLLAVRIGPPRRLDGQADLELPSDSALVAAALADRLAAACEH